MVREPFLASSGGLGQVRTAGPHPFGARPSFPRRLAGPPAGRGCRKASRHRLGPPGAAPRTARSTSTAATLPAAITATTPQTPAWPMMKRRWRRLFRNDAACGADDLLLLQRWRSGWAVAREYVRVRTISACGRGGRGRSLPEPPPPGPGKLRPRYPGQPHPGAPPGSWRDCSRCADNRGPVQLPWPVSRALATAILNAARARVRPWSRRRAIEFDFRGDPAGQRAATSAAGTSAEIAPGCCLRTCPAVSASERGGGGGMAVTASDTPPDGPPTGPAQVS